MSTVHSATSHALSQATHHHHHSHWNNWKISVLMGVGVVALYCLVRYLRAGNFTRTELGNGLDLRTRYLATLFPSSSMNTQHQLPFGQYAAGIFRINAQDLLSTPTEEVFIYCHYRGQNFCTQRMTPGTAKNPVFEAYVPEIPYGDRMTVKIFHQGSVKAEVSLQVDRAMGIYEIYIQHRQFTIESHPFTMPNPKNLYPGHQLRLDAPANITIQEDGVAFDRPHHHTGETPYTIVNMSTKVHILFFQVQGLSASLGAPEVYLLPIAVLPTSTRQFPATFLRRSWEIAYNNIYRATPPSFVDLHILNVRDTVSDPA